MKILVCGKPDRGVWTIRAEQLLRDTMGATLCPDPTAADLAHVSVVVRVKRGYPETGPLLRRWGGPVIHDLVDYWQQPGTEITDAASARKHFWAILDNSGSRCAVGATRKMAEDLANEAVHTAAVYHHMDARVSPTEIRPVARVLGYRGAPAWIRPAIPLIEATCKRLGLSFHYGDEIDLSQCDIGLALRVAPFDGYPEMNYKSNVKAANFIAAGLPFVGLEERGIVETVPREAWKPIWNERSLFQALDAARDEAWRLESNRILAAQRRRFTRQSCASQMQAVLAHAVTFHGK